MSFSSTEPGVAGTAGPVVVVPSMRWWSQSPTGWADVSERTCARWQQRPDAVITLDIATALRAMAFGYGARAAYGANLAWEELEQPLRGDWLDCGGESEHPWDLVKDAVLEGWTAAVPVVVAAIEATPAPPESASQVDPTRPVEPSEHQVAGGRPDRWHGA